MKVLTTGSVLTHGTPTGEKKDSSESNKEIAILTRLSMAANPTPNQLNLPSELKKFCESHMKNLSYKEFHLFFQ